MEEIHRYYKKEITLEQLMDHQVNEFKSVEKEFVRREVQFIPAKLIVEKNILHEL